MRCPFLSCQAKTRQKQHGHTVTAQCNLDAVTILEETDVVINGKSESKELFNIICLRAPGLCDGHGCAHVTPAWITRTHKAAPPPSPSSSAARSSGSKALFGVPISEGWTPVSVLF